MNSFTEIAIDQATAVSTLFPPASPRREPEAGPPLVLEADELARLQETEDLLVVDVRRPETCIDGHIPGAVSLMYQDLLREHGPAKGLLPHVDRLSSLFSGIGLTPERHVVAYDDDAGAGAARLLWTLDVIGHGAFSLLNGGFAAWEEADLPVVDELRWPERSDYCAVEDPHSVADYDYVLERLGDSGVTLLDARSAEEYSGKLVRGDRGGHIPGAVHFEWLDAVDPHDNQRLRSREELRERLASRGITPDREEIIVYCHTHHRSSHSYIVLKHLGYERVRAYAGSWSEWANRPDAPVSR